MGTRWTDEEGRDWNCYISIAEYERLRREDDIDLLEEGGLKRIFSSQIEIVKLMAAAHRKQLTERGISADDFYEICVSTESVGNASYDALVAALADFCRRLRKPALAKMIESIATAVKASENRAMVIMESQGQAVIDRAVSKATQSVEEAIAKAIE